MALSFPAVSPAATGGQEVSECIGKTRTVEQATTVPYDHAFDLRLRKILNRTRRPDLVDNMVAIIDAEALPAPHFVHGDHEFTPYNLPRQLDASDDSSTALRGISKNLVDNMPTIIDAEALPAPHFVHDDNKFTLHTHPRQLDASEDSLAALTDNESENMDVNLSSKIWSSVSAMRKGQVRQPRVYQPPRCRARGRRSRATTRTSSGSVMKPSCRVSSNKQENSTNCTQHRLNSDSVDVDMVASRLCACSLQYDPC